MATALLVIGSVFQLGGIVALGFPDLLPGALRLSRWLGRQGRRAANLLRRLLRRPPRGDVHVGAGTGTITLGGFPARGVVSTSATTLEEQLAYLLRRDQDVQVQTDALATRISRLETESPKQLEEARQQMEQHIADELAGLRAEYRPLRVAGTIAVVIGLACVTTATLLV
jgi:hypothetical protein